MENASTSYYVAYDQQGRFTRAKPQSPIRECEYCGRVNRERASCDGCGAPTGVVGVALLEEPRREGLAW